VCIFKFSLEQPMTRPEASALRVSPFPHNVVDGSAPMVSGH